MYPIMSYMQIILLAGIVLIILVLVDVMRRNQRKQYQVKMAALKQSQQVMMETEQKKLSTMNHAMHLDQSEQSTDQVQQDSATRQELSTFEALEQGFAILYIEAPRGSVLLGNDIQQVVRGQGMRLSDAGAFQMFSDDSDVLFSILPDTEERQFKRQTLPGLEVERLIAVLNYKKLSNLEYDPMACFKHFLEQLRHITHSLEGTLLNENKTRFTEHDQNAYEVEIKQA